jgi:general nucleoside transport system ATP-binding protein
VDRVNTSLVPGMTVEDNLGLRDFERLPLRRGPWLDRAAFRKQAMLRIAEFGIHCGGPDVPAQTLSGGNQQKIVVAREISRRPRVLVSFQPTVGLDPGATQFVFDQILALREAGGAVLYISSELEEVLMLGDRIGVIYNGKLSGIVSRSEADITRIGLLMAGVEEAAA